MGLTRIRAEQISDIDYKQAVRVITLSNITLVGGAPAEVDGVSLSTGSRILVNGQDNAAQNGLYRVQTVGAGSNGTWVRTNDGNEDGEILPGMVVMVTEGTVYADTPWKLTTNGDIEIGVTELTFAENYSLAFGNVFANGTAVIANTVSAPITFEAGTNVTIVGNNVTKTVTISATGGGGSGTPGGADTQVQFNDAGAFGGTAGFTFDKTTNAVSTTGTVTATGNVTGGNLITSGQTVTVGVTSTGNITSTGAINSFGDLVGNATFAAVPTRSLNLVGTSAVMKVARTTETGDPAVELQALVPGNAAILTYWDFFASGSLDNFTLRRRTGGSNESLLTANSAGVQFPTGAVTATGNISGGNLRTASVTIGNGPISGVTTISATGNANVGNLGAATVVATTLTGTLSTAAQTNITSVGTLTSLTVTGNVTGGNLITAGLVSLSSITKTGSNGVGNIGQSNNTFNTIFAKATSAQYADVAERYLADADYPTGTVLVFGGDQEVTQSQIDHGTAIAGTVSDTPAYVMNTGLTGDHVVSVALLGRVPVRVIGTIRPGDLLVASELPGIATSVVRERYAPGCVIGKALQGYDSQREGVIEAVVGRL